PPPPGSRSKATKPAGQSYRGRRAHKRRRLLWIWPATGSSRDLAARARRWQAAAAGLTDAPSAFATPGSRLVALSWRRADSQWIRSPGTMTGGAGELEQG